MRNINHNLWHHFHYTISSQSIVIDTMINIYKSFFKRSGFWELIWKSGRKYTWVEWVGFCILLSETVHQQFHHRGWCGHFQRNWSVCHLNMDLDKWEKKMEKEMEKEEDAYTWERSISFYLPTRKTTVTLHSRLIWKFSLFHSIDR